MVLRAFLLLSLTILASSPLALEAAVALEAVPVYFSFVTSFGRFGFNASDIIPAVDLALEHINSRSDLLAGYELGYLSVRDSKVSDVYTNCFFWRRSSLK